MIAKYDAQKWRNSSNVTHVFKIYQRFLPLLRDENSTWTRLWKEGQKPAGADSDAAWGVQTKRKKGILGENQKPAGADADAAWGVQTKLKKGTLGEN